MKPWVILGDIARNNKLLKTTFDELLLPKAYHQLMKERMNIGNVYDDVAGSVNADDPRAAHEALMKEFTNVYEALGENFVQPMMDHILKPLTGVLRDISQWAPNDMLLARHRSLATSSSVRSESRPAISNR